MNHRTVACPTCQQPVEWSPASAWRPFCSERCKLIDLGAWVSGERAIPGEEMPVVRGDDDQPDPPRH